MVKYIKTFIFVLFLSNQIYGQYNEIDTIQFLVFDKEPIEINENKCTRSINLRVQELVAIIVSDSIVKFEDKKDDTEIIIKSKKFQTDLHDYDYEKYLIDGKVVFGHDGFSSKDYVANNFHRVLSEIKIKEYNSKLENNIVDSNFPLFINPYIADYSGNCFVKCFKVEKFFRYILIINGGGGGAGSFENYILIDIYNRGWIYSKDIITDNVLFIPMNNQKDPFLKNGKKNWYKVFLL